MSTKLLDAHCTPSSRPVSTLQEASQRPGSECQSTVSSQLSTLLQTSASLPSPPTIASWMEGGARLLSALARGPRSKRACTGRLKRLTNCVYLHKHEAGEEKFGCDVNEPMHQVAHPLPLLNPRSTQPPTYLLSTSYRFPGSTVTTVSAPMAKLKRE